MPKRNERSEDYPSSGDGRGGSVASADVRIYLCDMILELQQLASKAGCHEVAFRLLAAYEAAERTVERKSQSQDPLSRSG